MLITCEKQACRSEVPARKLIHTGNRSLRHTQDNMEWYLPLVCGTWINDVYIAKQVKENGSTWGGLEPPKLRIHAKCSNHARHLLSLVFFLNWLWRYRYFFVVMLTFNVLTVSGQQHSFSTHERMFWGTSVHESKTNAEMNLSFKLRRMQKISNDVHAWKYRISGRYITPQLNVSWTTKMDHFWK